MFKQATLSSIGSSIRPDESEKKRGRFAPDSRFAQHPQSGISAASEHARQRFIEFFTVEILNKNTRRAYAEAVR
jgi:hypothetical protein